MINVLTVVGARPQFIKAAVLSKTFIQSYPRINENIIHTGQHFDNNMSAIFFDELEISKPSFNLGIGGGSHGENTGKMIIELEKIFKDKSPDCVLVYGDTDSTLAASIASSKLNLPLIHVESGMRCADKSQPEEINRIVTDHLSDLLICSTEKSQQNLFLEGLGKDNSFFYGDIMFELFNLYKKLDKFNPLKFLDKFGSEFILMTLHRRENISNAKRLMEIIKGIEMTDQTFIFPLHPSTKKYFSEYNIELPKNIKVINPLGYIDMQSLLLASKLVVTDSGGLQKEAFFAEKPSVILRDKTEWKELVDCGASNLINYDHQSIFNQISSSLNKKITHKNIFGNSDTSVKICGLIMKNFS